MGNLFCIRKLLVTKRKLDIKGHYRPFLSKFFLPHSVKEHRRVAPQCFRNFRVSKKFMHKKWISRNSVNSFFSHSAEIFYTGTLQCFRKFVYRKGLCIKRRYHDLLWNFFCLTVPNVFVWEHFCVLEKFWYREKLYIKGGYRNFLSKFFVSQCRKSSYRSPSLFQKISCIEKVYAKK